MNKNYFIVEVMKSCTPPFTEAVVSCEYKH